MGISSFPAQTGFDPSKLKNITEAFSQVTTSGFNTILDITGQSGLITAFYCAVDNIATGQHAKIRITKDGVVIAYAGGDTSASTNLRFMMTPLVGIDDLTDFYGLFPNGRFEITDSLNNMFDGSTNGSILQTFASNGNIYFLNNEIFKFKTSLKIEIETSASEQRTCYVTYESEEWRW